MNELEIVQYGQLEGLHVFFNTVDYRTSHFHPEWELVWLLENPLAIAYRQKRFVLEPGQLMLFEPNEPHEFHKVEGEATFLCLQLSPQLLPQVKRVTMEENLPHVTMEPKDLQRLKQQLSDIAEAYLTRPENYELCCVGTSCMVLYELLRSLPHHRMSPEEATGIDRRNARLDRLIRFVDENYMQKIRLEDFAEQEHCSLGYLSKFIKEAMNQTFREYVTSVRFNCACKLIAEGDMRMLDVCMASGFSDYRYFSRAFQENYHMTPEEFSRCKQQERLEPLTVRHSLHSIEKIYSRKESLRLLNQYGI